MVATPSSGDNVILGANTLTINGSETGVTTIGAITSSSNGSVIINSTDGAVDVTIGSIVMTGAGDITQALAVDEESITTTVTGAVSTGGNLEMTNASVTAKTNALTIGGALTVGGTTTITGSTGASGTGGITILTVTGNAAFTGLVTVAGGATDAAADATLTLNGATNTATAGIVLADGTTGQAILVFNGTSAQTFTGTIAGGSDNEGTIEIGDATNASNVTFASDIGDATNTGASGTARDSISILTIKNKATATFNGEVELGGDLTIGSTTGTGTATFNKMLMVGGTTDIDGTVTFGNAAADDVHTLGDGTATDLVTIGANKDSTIVLASRIDAKAAAATAVTVGAAGDDRVVTFNIKKTSTFDPTNPDNDSATDDDAIVTASNAAGGITITGGLKVGLDANTKAIANGSTIRVLKSTAATGTDLEAAVADTVADGKIELVDSALIDLQLDEDLSDADNLVITVVYKTPTNVTGPARTILPQALTAASAKGDDTGFAALLTAADTSTAALQTAGEQVAGPANPGGAAATVVGNSSTQTTNIMGARLASLREGADSAAATGFAGGSTGLNKSVWIKPYTHQGNQGTRNGVSGFNSATYGFLSPAWMRWCSTPCAWAWPPAMPTPMWMPRTRAKPTPISIVGRCPCMATTPPTGGMWKA
ncbi:MAG: outer membrane autotransporter [Rhodospirillaceae bacterium]|nr:MAG: outer membrane autotransporter [Rhodospirillaceae bacterium]